MNKETALSTVKFIVNWMKGNQENSALIRFHGGEPTLNMDILCFIVEKLEEYKDCFDFSFEITTNAYSLNENQIMYLCSKIDDISISLDGPEKFNDRNRILKNGEGTFKEVYKNALYMRDLFEKLTIRMTVNSSMAENVYDNVLFFVINGFKQIIMALDIWDDNWDMELLDTVENACRDVGRYISENNLNNVSFTHPFIGEQKRRRCEGGLNGFQINPLGRLFPCSFTVNDDEYCCGTVFDGIDIKKVACFDKIYDTPIISCEGCTNYDNCMTVRCKYINKIRMGAYNIPIPLVCQLENRKLDFN